jgi:hypothetical protein
MMVTGAALLFYWVATKTNTHKEAAFIYLFYSFMIFPILNPCISLSFIAAYRRSFYDFWRWIAGVPMMHGGWKVSPSQQGTTNTIY